MLCDIVKEISNQCIGFVSNRHRRSSAQMCAVLTAGCWLQWFYTLTWSSEPGREQARLH